MFERTSHLFAPFYQSKDFYAKGAIGYQAKYALFHSQVTFNAFCRGDRVPKLCFEISFYAFLRHAVSLRRSFPYLLAHFLSNGNLYQFQCVQLQSVTPM